MARKTKKHFINKENDKNTPVCGNKLGDTTTDPKKVTCLVCGDIMRGFRLR